MIPAAADIATRNEDAEPPEAPRHVVGDPARAPLLRPLSSEASYARAARGLRLMTIVLSVVIAVLTGVLFDRVFNGKIEDRYYARISSGESMQIVGLDEPYTSTPFILNWGAMAVTDILTFGFNDIDARFEQTRQYFTDEGWTSFYNAISRASLPQTVIKNQQLVTAIARGLPEIAFEGIEKGKYIWLVKLPVSMTIRAGSKVVQNNITVFLTVVRVPTSKNPMGIGIDNWVSG